MSFIGNIHHILVREAGRRFTALLLLMVMTSLTVTSHCHDIGPKAVGHHAPASVPQAAADIPCCPIDDHDHADLDHCASCLHCACNAPLANPEPCLSYAPAISSLSHVDRFNHLPEVYFPIFIPPQNLS